MVELTAHLIPPSAIVVELTAHLIPPSAIVVDLTAHLIPPSTIVVDLTELTCYHQLICYHGISCGGSPVSIHHHVLWLISQQDVVSLNYVSPPEDKPLTLTTVDRATFSPDGLWLTTVSGTSRDFIYKAIIQGHILWGGWGQRGRGPPTFSSF